MDVFNAANELKRTRNFEYNTKGQLVREYGPNNGFGQTYEKYDDNGNLTFTRDASSRSKSYVYDALNRLKEIHNNVNFSVGDTHSPSERYGYDVDGNLTTVTDPNQVITQYVYNGFGDLTRVFSPDTGTANFTEYDNAGNLKTRVDARNRTGSFGYDVLNRVESASVVLRSF